MKARRRKVECVVCGSIFNSDFKQAHERAKHDGKKVQVKEVGAPLNPFEAAKKRKLHGTTGEEAGENLTSETILPSTNVPLESQFVEVVDDPGVPSTGGTKALSLGSAPQIEKSKGTMDDSTGLSSTRDVQDVFSGSAQHVGEVEDDPGVPSTGGTKALSLGSAPQIEKSKGTMDDSTGLSTRDVQDVSSGSAQHVVEVEDDPGLPCPPDCQDASSSLREKSFAEFMGGFAAALQNMSHGKLIFEKHNNITIMNDKLAVVEVLEFLEYLNSDTSALIQKGIEFLSCAESNEERIKISDSTNVSAVIPHDPGLRDPVRNDNEREYLISKGPHQPILPHFPSDGKDRFNANWYKTYAFLEYSIAKDAAFCFICWLFPHGPGREKAENNWIQNGVKSWGKMRSSGKEKAGKLPMHFSSNPHNSALRDYNNFLKKSGHVESLLDKNRRQILIENERIKAHNTEVVTILLDTARTLAMQGIAFRGSDNSDKDGNFYQIARLVSKYNPILKSWFDNRLMRPYHVTYLSNTSQNEFINLIACEVRRDMISRINESPFFCVMADTTPDMSHKDMLSVVVRITDKDSKPIEYLLEIREAKDKTGEGLAKEILQTLSDNLVDSSKLVSQSYDFALSMSGQFNGAQQKLSEMVGRSIPYIPCQDHRTNTVLEHSCNASVVVSGALDVMESLYAFFTMSTKRFQNLASKLSLVMNATNLRNLSQTRWTAQAETVAAIQSSFETIVEVLGDLSRINDKQTKIKALGLYKKMLSPDFIISLFFLKNILPKIKILTEKIESPNLNVVDCADVIKATITVLSRIRDDSQEINNLISSASAFAEKFNIDVEYEYQKIHHRRLKPKKLDEHPETQSRLQNSSEFYRTEFIKMLDFLVTGLTENVDRIVETMKPIFTLFKMPFDRSNLTMKNIENVIELMPNLSERPDPSVLKCEFEVLYELRSAASSFSELQDSNIGRSLKNVFKVIQLATTVGYGVASNERSFSQLKLVKNHLRTTMSDKRLNDVLLLTCEKDLTENVNLRQIVSRWRDLKQRRIEIL